MVPKFVDHQQSESPDISSALVVEQLDTDLFRSRSLYLPFEARGVFGGQLISQSLVAATKSVKSEFTLHVSSILTLPTEQHKYLEPHSHHMYVISAHLLLFDRQHS